MKRTLGLVVAAGIFASAAMGANLNVSVESGGSNTIAVAPGATVDYSVMGQLDTDVDNRGLALVGLDLEVLIEGTSTQAVALPQANHPVSVEMLNFAVPEGINNPAGFGGTDSSGKLLQLCGAQNTINDTLACGVDADCPGASNLCDGGICTASAPFPLGTVIENLGHTEIELVNGSFTAPMAEGIYVLTLTDLFANVISITQNSPDFLATESAGVGSIDNLTITVAALAVEFGTWESVVNHGATVGDVPLTIAEDGSFVESRMKGVTKILVGFTGVIDPASAGPGSVTISGCDTNGTAINLATTTIGTTVLAGDEQMEINISPKLPGSGPADLPAKYLVTLSGITSAGGSAVQGANSRLLRAIVGDVVSLPNGSGHVNASDAGITRSFAASGVDPIDPGNIAHVRADVTGDGKVNSSDAGLVRSMAAQGKDGRAIPCP